MNTDSIEYLTPLNVVRTVVLLDLDTFDDKNEEIETFKSGDIDNIYNDKDNFSNKNNPSNNGKIIQTNKTSNLKLDITDDNYLIGNEKTNHDELLNNSNEEEKKNIFNEVNISRLLKTISNLIYKYFFKKLSNTINSSNKQLSKKTPIFSTLIKINQEKQNKKDERSFSSNNSEKSLPEFNELQSISSEKSVSSEETNPQKLDEVADIKTNPFIPEIFSSKTVNDNVKFRYKSIVNSKNTSGYSENSKNKNCNLSSKNNINRKKTFNMQMKKIKLIKEDKKKIKNNIKEEENKIRKRDMIKHLVRKKIIKNYFNKWKLTKNKINKKKNKAMRQLTLSSNTIIQSKKINNELYQDIKEKTKLFRLILINFALIKSDNKNLESVSDDFD